MHQVFAAHVPGGASTGLSEGGEGQGLSLMAMSMAPGTIPSTVNPPRAPVAGEVAMAPATRLAAVAPPDKSSLMSSLRKVSSNATADTTAVMPRANDGRPAAAAPKPIAAKPADSKPVERKPAEIKQAAARPPFKPAATGAIATTASAQPQTGLVTGASPIVPTNSFDTRFSAMK
jgi:hypothetical protein